MRAKLALEYSNKQIVIKIASQILILANLKNKSQKEQTTPK